MSRPALPLFTALRDGLAGYDRQRLRGDVLAGLTVGLIAVPLAMALAIASGVPPQHGLYTAIFAGLVIALCGGSRVNVSGPTAAFVVILLPITQQFGLPGLLLATMMAGLILIALGLTGLGRLVQFIPYPVTTGFTAGIAIVIAGLQLNDFFGLGLPPADAHFLPVLGGVLSHLDQLRAPDTLIGVFTLAVLILWPRLKTALPSYLVALFAGTLLALLLSATFEDFAVARIGTRFQYLAGGTIHAGIPHALPALHWPWQIGDGLPLTLDTFRTLLGPAFAIAILGAIESLLCAVVSDGLSGYRHDPNGELIGQGLGNLVAPLFGGITATAALARTAANVRSGASSPIAAGVHALTVLAALLLLAPVLQHIPMAALAALLMMVAWNMSDAHRVVHVLRISPKADVAVLVTCLALTVVFDMVLAVEVGLLLAAVLFIRRMIELTGAQLVSDNSHHGNLHIDDSVAVYDINGPLFFGAAETAMHALWRVDPKVRHVLLDMQDVMMMDLTAIVALESLISELQVKRIAVHLCDLQPHVEQKLRRAGLIGERSWARRHATLDAALAAVNAQPRTASEGHQ